jgi:hypothetical protein
MQHSPYSGDRSINGARSLLALVLAAFHIVSTGALVTVAITTEIERRSGEQSTLNVIRLLATSICGPLRERATSGDRNVD